MGSHVSYRENVVRCEIVSIHQLLRLYKSRILELQEFETNLLLQFELYPFNVLQLTVKVSADAVLNYLLEFILSCTDGT